MTKAETIENLTGTIKSFNRQVVQIQQKFRARREKLLLRESAIKGSKEKEGVWARECDFLSRFFAKKKKGEKQSKKVAKLVGKVTAISKAIRDRILFIYMTRQKFYYTIRFLQWLINYRGEGYELDQLEEMRESIDRRGDWIHEIDCMLFGNQEWIPTIMPEHITILQKALKKSSPKKKKEKVLSETDDDEEAKEDSAVTKG